MKEIQQKEKDKVVITKQAEQEKQLKLVGRIRPHKGHTIFEVNLSNGEVRKAEFEDSVARYAPKTEGRSLRAHVERFDTIASNPVSRKVKVNPDCIYVSALNLNNLFRKLKKAGIVNDKYNAE